MGNGIESIAKCACSCNKINVAGEVQVPEGNNKEIEKRGFTTSDRFEPITSNFGTVPNLSKIEFGNYQELFYFLTSETLYTALKKEKDWKSFVESLIKATSPKINEISSFYSTLKMLYEKLAEVDYFYLLGNKKIVTETENNIYSFQMKHNTPTNEVKRVKDLVIKCIACNTCIYHILKKDSIERTKNYVFEGIAVLILANKIMNGQKVKSNFNFQKEVCVVSKFISEVAHIKG